jgi:hypothetical protein
VTKPSSAWAPLMPSSELSESFLIVPDWRRSWSTSDVLP